MEWSNAVSLELIEEYRNHAALWDNADPRYRISSSKYKSWRALAAMFTCDVIDVRRKMNSLLTSHRRERHKVAQGYKSEWFAYDAFRFLGGKFPVLKIEAGGVELADETEEYLLEDEEYAPKKEMKRLRKFKTSRKKLPPVKIVNKTRSKPSTSRSSHRDDCDIFGEYVADALKQHDSRTKAMIKHAINNILFESEMKKYPPVGLFVDPGPSSGDNLEDMAEEEADEGLDEEEFGNEGHAENGDSDEVQIEVELAD